MLFRQEHFPNLHAGNHQDTSRSDKHYNCIAWAAGRDDASWDHLEGDDPEVLYYGPPSAPRDYNVTSLIAAFESVGFIVCDDGKLEDGVEKIAIYADGPEYMHAARQLESGKWTSKMGKAEDIEHDAPDDVAGGYYGEIARYMQRKRRAQVEV